MISKCLRIKLYRLPTKNKIKAHNKKYESNEIKLNKLSNQLAEATV